MTFVILDRDGVINEDSPEYIKSADEWQPILGSLEAIAMLTKKNIDVFIATNQAGIARGIIKEVALGQIHEKLLSAVKHAGGRILDIKVCPHHPNENCWCRKPNPGLLQELARSHRLSLHQGFYVGDSLKDLQAASNAGCKGALVLTGNGLATLKSRPGHQPVFKDLLAFAKSIVR